MRPERDAVDAIVRAALFEDAPWGDVTSQALLPATARARVLLVAREAGVLCGEELFAAAMQMVDAGTRVVFDVHDGQPFAKGAVLARAEGTARGVLQAERVGLNFVQRLSGIATATAAYVAAVQGTRARIVDTRKTTPGLRMFERYAVRCGGGHNHRYSLSDAVLVKDNHLAALGLKGAALTAALRAARSALPHTTHFEVEVDRLDQLDAVLGAGVYTVMLDNFSLADLRAGVAKVAGRCLVEASGGVTLESVGAIAATGVDLISVGALTHSVRALDLGLDFEVR